MTKEELALAVIERLKQEYPDADCTLDYDQAWKLLVSVRLAAQCTDARVNVVVEDLYRPYKPKRRTRATIARDTGGNRGNCAAVRSWKEQGTRHQRLHAHAARRVPQPGAG